MSKLPHPAAALLLTLLSCDKGDAGADSAPAAWRPDLACPGDVGCESNDGALRAGFGKQSITPICYESWIDVDENAEYNKNTDTFLDCGCDRLCPEDEGYPGADEGEGDGEFKAMWMGGFSQSHPAMGSHDELWARVVVLDQGATRVAVVSLDLVGFFNEDVVKVRALVEEAKLDVDHVLITSTHQHEGPDTMGLWGPSFGKTGYQEDYVAYVRSQTVKAIADAVGALAEVGAVKVGSALVEESHPRGQANFSRDSRDPVIFPDDVNIAALYDTSGAVMGSMVNWGNHPEALSDENFQMTSDFVHYIRETVEGGSSWSNGEGVEGIGGTCVFIQGSVGGLMTPLGVRVQTPDGGEFSASTFEKAEALGVQIGEIALGALTSAETLSAPKLSFAQTIFFFPVDNFGFQAAFNLGVFDRQLYNYDPEQDIDEGNTPEVLTEVNVLTLGELQLLTVPGELFPEIAIGGYDGSMIGTDEYSLIKADNPNPPDLTIAPAAPYLRDEMAGKFRWIVGLGNDELGYIIPEYDFITHPDAPYVAEAEGDHYEETNSLGPRTQPILTEQATRLLEWSR